MFTFSPIQQRLDLLCDYVRNEAVDGKPLERRPGHPPAHRPAVTKPRWRGCSGCGSSRVDEGGAPPTTESSEYKLYATELSKRLANASMDIGGPGGQLRVHTEDAPMKGRSESTYRYTVIDTIGGGASEIQKNIIARRKLGLPKNF